MASPVYVVVTGPGDGSVYPVMLRAQHQDNTANMGGDLLRALRYRPLRDPGAAHVLAEIVRRLPMAEFSIEPYDECIEDGWRLFWIDLKEGKLRNYNLYLQGTMLGAALEGGKPSVEASIPMALEGAH